MKQPFTDKEQKIMDLLVKAHNEYLKIDKTNKRDLEDWIKGIHDCQNVLIKRVVKRDYPETFN